MPSGEKGAKAYLRAAAGYFLQTGLREQFAKLAISSDFAAIGASFLCVPDWLAEQVGFEPRITFSNSVTPDVCVSCRQ